LTGLARKRTKERGLWKRNFPNLENYPAFTQQIKGRRGKKERRQIQRISQPLTTTYSAGNQKIGIG